MTIHGCLSILLEISTLEEKILQAQQLSRQYGLEINAKEILIKLLNEFHDK